MNDKVYIDTSALAKWYLNEENSDKFEQFIQSVPSVFISALTITEMRSLLARRRRMQEITEHLEIEIFSTFQMDIDQGYLNILSNENHHFEQAVHIISSLQQVALRTLDALHLAVVKDAHISVIATADQTMIEAAKQLDIQVKTF